MEDQAIPFKPSLLACLSKQVKFDIRTHLGRYPRLFLPLAHLRRKSRRDVDWLTSSPISESTEMVIEGFQRSANTFATIAFITTQKDHISVAHHVHAPAQISRAVRLHIPAIVLIREPSDAVLSLLIRQPCLSPRQAIARYINFYKPLVPFRSAFITATFDEVVSDFGEVVRHVNHHYGTCFQVFEHSADNVEKIFQLIEERDREKLGGGKVSERSVARPSNYRVEQKKQLQHRLTSPKLKALLSECNEVFRIFVGS